MNLVEELITDLESSVGGRPTSYNTKTAAWDIYEGFIFGLVIRAAWAAGGSVRYEDFDGNAAAKLLFRTSPGMLYSQAHRYTHAVVDFPGCDPLEVHVGVRVQGRSGVLHECDVLVLPSDEADLSRSSKLPHEDHDLCSQLNASITRRTCLFISRADSTGFTQISA